MGYHVYFLLSRKDNGFYIGCSSKNPFERLKNYHNKGNVKSTKPRIPFDLAYYEIYNDKNSAYKREYFLKHPEGYQEKLIIINLIKNTSGNKLPIIIKNTKFILTKP
ncbi:MAG: GIY-YIG nuclease family protein [Candidatus Parcubacteria bacterium]|nr:GIY-YIG nuclease family protein [Candidatus Parcubacteria bacterium]